MANENDIIARLKVEGVEKFKADIEGSVTSTKKLQTSVKEAGDTGSTAIDGLGKAFDDAKTGVDELNKSTESYKSQLKKMQTEIVGLTMELHDMRDAGKSGTKEFDALDKKIKEITNKAGNLKDALADASDVIKNAGSDTRGLDKALRGVTSLASGFQVVEGATALFGAKSEDLQKALVRLNGVMSITQGLQQIQNELTKNDSIFTGALTKAKAGLNWVIGQGSLALKGFRLALASVGIGVAIAIISELMKNWDKLATAIFGATKKTETYAEMQERLKKVEEDRQKLQDAEIRYLKAKGIAEGDVLKVQLANAKVSLSQLEEKIRLEKALAGYYDKNPYNPNLTKDRESARKREMAVEKQYETQLLNAKSGVLEIEKAIGETNKKATDKTKKDVKDLKDKSPVIIKIESDQKDFKTKLDDLISQTEKDLKDLFSAELLLGNNPQDNPQIQYLVRQLGKYKKDLEITQEAFDNLVNPTAITPIAPVDITGITQITDLGLEKKKKPLTLIERIFGTDEENKEKEKRIENYVRGALDIVNEFNNIGSQIGDIATQVINRRSEQELQKLENQRKSGLISQQQFEKKSAEIKNQSARKQRAVDVAMALAKVPEVVLNAYLSGSKFGIAIASVLSGIAGAFALAQVALIASAPLPKFREGGSVAKRLGLINGNKHEQGGVPIEVEGGEYVIKSQAVKTYGVKLLDNINNMKFNPVINAGDKLKSAKNKDYKLNENLATISSYLKQNYKIDSQGNFILSEIRDAVKSNKKAYV